MNEHQAIAHVLMHFALRFPNYDHLQGLMSYLSEPFTALVQITPSPILAPPRH